MAPGYILFRFCLTMLSFQNTYPLRYYEASPPITRILFHFDHVQKYKEI